MAYWCLIFRFLLSCWRHLLSNHKLRGDLIKASHLSAAWTNGGHRMKISKFWCESEMFVASDRIFNQFQPAGNGTKRSTIEWSASGGCLLDRNWRRNRISICNELLVIGWRWWMSFNLNLNSCNWLQVLWVKSSLLHLCLEMNECNKSSNSCFQWKDLIQYDSSKQMNSS